MKLKKVSILLLALAACGSVATYVAAQAQKPGPTQHDAGAVAGCCTHAEMDCPMFKLVDLAQVRVEKTKTGASVHITAKDAGKLLEVQALTEKIGEHMKAGGCSMMSGKPGSGHGHHHHGKTP